MNSIPVFKPSMNKEKILSELEKIFDSGWIGLGPKTREFEEKFAEYHGSKYALALNSCTAALHMAVVAADVCEGDEILVPAMTFASSALVALYEKATPVFVDCHYDTLVMNLDDLERKITSRTKAIIGVHFGGHAFDVQRTLQIAKKHNLVVIEDCAHACGGSIDGKKVGSFGAMSCYSFHAVKNLPTGDGGMICTDDPTLFERLKKLRWLGIDKDTWARSGGRYAWKYSIDTLGYKYHMNDISAVIGLAQLELLDDHNQKRRKLAYRYIEKLKDITQISLPVEKNNVTSAWHNFVIKIKNGRRDDLCELLAKDGISTGVHYEPIHQHRVFQNRSIANDLKVSEQLQSELLTLPLYPDLSEKEQDIIVSMIKKFFLL